jgi:oligopeptide transport system ATP-binding protein
MRCAKPSTRSFVDVSDHESRASGTTAAGADSAPLLAVDDLHVHFWTDRGTIHAVNGVSFAVTAGETLGIVGESGCGKSVTSLALLGILPRAGRAVAGTAQFQGRDLLKLSDRQLRAIRGKDIAMIFQDPMTSLNPVLTIGRQLREAMEAHLDLDRGEAERRSAELLDQVGIPSAKARLKDYPHQFSGGMRQRAMIAMALACEPKLLIADEPTTALDVTIQAQILDLLRQLVAERSAALVLITHDLGVVAGMCQRVNVMYAGTIVEEGSAEQLFARPRHPYTLGLLQSVPRLDTGRRQPLHPIAGAPRNMLSPPTSCPFAPRCRFRSETCEQRLPVLERLDTGQRAACFHPVDPGEWQRTRLGGTAA